MLTFKELGRYGRLGNQMFQIASTIGLATRHGYKYGFPYWMNYDHMERFGSNEDCDIQSYFVNPLPLVDEKAYTDYFIHWGYHNYHGLQDNLNLTGHMQSEKYFDHCKDLIRHYFEMKPLTDIEIPAGAIAIHVRRGDYDDNYHPTQKLDYYQKALSLLPAAPVYVFSDDPKEAERMFPDATVFRYNHYMLDFQLMTKCTHFILSNSTYCWWAWWLADHGQCIAPRKWFGDHVGLETRDIYTSEMIVI